MYEDHPIFIQPEDEEIKVWRYMDFTKLVSLINSQRLYFSRADKLGDPFEGSLPKINVAARGLIPKDIPLERHEQYQSSMLNLGNVSKQFPRFHAICCWHMNKHESAAMWRLYLKSNEGIAIQSTYAKLKRSLIDDETIYLGKVKYIDYDTEYIDGGNLFAPFVHKRMSYAFEQEVRAIILKLPTKVGSDWLAETTIEHGLEISVDIETLIERIHVSPTAPSWFADLVKAVISKYGNDFEVAQSKLNENPVF